MRIRCPSCGAVAEANRATGNATFPCERCGATLRLRTRPHGNRPCPSCGKRLVPNAVICVHCGHHLRRGGRVQSATATGHAASRSRLPSPFATFIGEWLPGLVRLRVLLWALALAAPAIGLIWGTFVWFLTFQAPAACVLAAAIGLIIYAQAIAWILDGELSLLQDALASFDGVRWVLFGSLLLGSLTALFGLLKARFY